MESLTMRRPARLTIVSLASSLGLMSGHAAAEENRPSKPDIVVVGRSLDNSVGIDRITTNIVDAPTISVVSREELADRGINDLADGLRTVPGIEPGRGRDELAG